MKNAGDQGYILLQANVLDRKLGTWTNHDLAGPTEDYKYLVRLAVDRVIGDLNQYEESATN